MNSNTISPVPIQQPSTLPPEHNHSLVSLGLSGTNCGGPGAELLLRLLDSNPTLTDVWAPALAVR